MRKPIPEEIKNTYWYDPESGNFYRAKYKKDFGVESKMLKYEKKTRNYCVLTFKGKRFAAHRVAWFFYYGTQPPKIIDHINGNTTDNRIANLREATDILNQTNSKKHREGKKPGCYFRKNRNKWIARTEFSGKVKYLGTYDSEEKAFKAYQNFFEKKGIKLGI